MIIIYGSSEELLLTLTGSTGSSSTGGIASTIGSAGAGVASSAGNSGSTALGTVFVTTKYQLEYC